MRRLVVALARLHVCFSRAFAVCAQVFKPGKGTITIYENTDGKRGAQLYQLKGIPLTP